MPNEFEFGALPTHLGNNTPAATTSVPASETNTPVVTAPTSVAEILPDATLQVYFAKATGGYFGEVRTPTNLTVVIGRTWEGFVNQLEKLIRSNG